MPPSPDINRGERLRCEGRVIAVDAYTRRQACIVGAFTLVETMVSMAVLVLLVAILSQALMHTGGIWNQGEANKERMQNERAICDFIATELRAALLPVDRTSQANLQFIVNPATVTSATFGNRDCIFWQAPLASDQTLGDIAEIGYFVKWDAVTNSQNPQAQLCRLFVNSSSGATPNTNFKIYSNPTAWISDTTIQAAAPAGKADHYQGLLAENVLGFWVRCLDVYGQQITQDYRGVSLKLSGGNYTFDSRRGYTDSKGGQSSCYVDSTGSKQPLCALPPIVEVSLVLLDAKSAAKIGTVEQSAITTICRDVNTIDANAFVAAAQVDPTLQKVRAGLRAYQMRINLQNSK